ncbi:autotransporter-associated beta strand repeat-containing protein [Verrucomicrobium sp. BvORR034]|uniref:beta strand repeat-containing protein n=1 Tax=Verrucomicrobium sp. BvORR034 TaxID=1396418 RepID=UPI0006793F78|nr:autotransporter-associated beta strand repeat-containing protein [Verrucomicrobium sp. BvORR034]
MVKRYFSLLYGLFCSSVLFLGARQGCAADGIWLETSGGARNWSDAANWLAGVAGSTDGSVETGAALFLFPSEPTAITIDADRKINSMSFQAGGFTFVGEKLHLSAGGEIAIVPPDPGQPMITTDVRFDSALVLDAVPGALTGGYTFRNAVVAGLYTAPQGQPPPPTPRLIITGNISAGESASLQKFTLNLEGTTGSRNSNQNTANWISGVISDGGAAPSPTGPGQGLAVRIFTNGPTEGAWYLSGANTYTGGTDLARGTLFINSLANYGQASSLGSDGAITLGNGTFLMYVGAATSTNRAFVSNGNSWFNNGGTITLSADGSLVTNGLTFRGGGNFVVDALVTGTGGLNRTDAGTVFLSNANNSFAGNISISVGAFSTNDIDVIGENSAIGRGSQIGLGQSNGGATTGNNIGKFIFTGANGGYTNRTIRINNGLSGTTAVGGGVIENTVVGKLLEISGDVSTASASTASTLELTGAGNGKLSGNVTGAPLLTLSKTGSGTWEISGVNTHRGETQIKAGTLLVSSLTGTGTSSVITSGTGRLGGTGGVSGAAGGFVTIASGTQLMVGNTHGILAGAQDANGYNGAASQFSLGGNTNVAITLGGTLQFDLFSGSDGVTLGSADKLVVSTTASTLTLGGVVTVADSTGAANWRTTGTGAWTTGSWQLFDWSGASAATKTGAFTYNLSTGRLALGYTWDTSQLTTTGVLSVREQTGSEVHIWTGTNSASWADAGNWTAGSIPGASNDVIFAGAAPTTTTHAGDRTVRNVLFTGTADYTITNTSGGGVLYLAGDAVNGGTIESRGGTQIFNTGVRVGVSSSDVYIINNGTAMNFNSHITANDWGGAPTNKTIYFSGSGNTYVTQLERRHATYDLAVVKNGSGTLTINGANSLDVSSNTAVTFTGTTTINEGKIRINQERALGGNPTAYNAGHLTLNGGVLGAYASFAIDDENRGITLGETGGGFDVEGSFNLTIANRIVGTGGLQKTGTGILSLTSDNQYAGNTVVSAGTLLVGNTTGSATGAGGVSVTGTAVLAGNGSITASAGKSISIGSTAILRVGATHGVAGAAGSLTLGSSANVSLSLGGTLQFDLFGNQAGLTAAEADVLHLATTASTLALGGNVVVADMSGGSLWTEGTWKLIDWSGVDFATTTLDGAFTFDFTAALGSLATGYTWDTSNFLVDGTISIVASANAHIWLGTNGGSWADAANWQAGTVPDATNDVIFGSAGVTTVTAINENKYVRNMIFTGEKNYTVNTGTAGVIYASGTRLEVRGGTQVINAQFRPTSAGNFTIANDGQLTFGGAILTNAGGTLNLIFDGTGNTSLTYVSRRENRVVNLVKNGTGTVTFSGFTENAAFDANGAYITGTTTINAGKVRINDERNLGNGPTAFDDDHLTINGGTLAAYANVTIDDANRGVKFGTNGATLEVEQAAHTLTVANAVTGDGGLNKTGPGTVVITGSNTYTGNTLISSGVFLANNATGSATGSGSVSTLAGSGATLGGTGSISGGSAGSITINSGTQLRIGTTHGVAGGGAQDFQLGQGGNVAITLAGSLQFDLFGNEDGLAGTESDRLIINTSASEIVLGGTIVVADVSGGSGWTSGVWQLIDWASLGTNPTRTGAFNFDFSAAMSSLADGYTWSIDDFLSNGTISVVAVPEPSRVLLVMLGAGALLSRRRRVAYS